MAIWQFDFYLVDKNFNDINAEPSFDCITPQSLDNLSKSLPLGESWSKNLIVYGNLEQTCVELFYEEKKLDSVSIRIDLRSVNKEMLTLILDFIKANNAKIFQYDKKVIFEPTLENLVQAIKESNSFRSCKNPREFLGGLIKKKK